MVETLLSFLFLALAVVACLVLAAMLHDDDEPEPNGLQNRYVRNSDTAVSLTDVEDSTHPDSDEIPF